MALIVLLAGGLFFVSQLQSNRSVACLKEYEENLKKDDRISKNSISDKDRNMLADFEIGYRPTLNKAPLRTTGLDSQNDLIRADNDGDLTDIYTHANSFTQSLREQSEKYGKSAFDVDNIRILIGTSNKQRTPGVMLLHPDVIPGAKEKFFTNVVYFREDSKIPLELQTQKFKEPYSKTITPIGYNAHDRILSIQREGDPWGKTGVFTHGLREGAHRLDGTADFDELYQNHSRLGFTNNY